MPAAQPFPDERRRSAANVLENSTLDNGKSRLSVTSRKVQEKQKTMLSVFDIDRHYNTKSTNTVL